MAWNPSPEVQVARDAAAAIGRVTGGTIDVCVVMWIDGRSRAGYASYGRTPGLCGMARRVADAAYQAVSDSEKFDAICHAVTRGHERATDGSGIDFAALEAEVVGKLRLLRAALAAEMDARVGAMMVRDLVLPAAELLARFCACVDITEDQP